MSTVGSEIECPKCNYENAYYEIDCRRQTEWITCSRCGYSYLTGEPETTPSGAVHYQFKNEKISVGGQYDNLEDWKKFVKKYKNKLQESSHTECIKGKWYKINDLTGTKEIIKNINDKQLQIT